MRIYKSKYGLVVHEVPIETINQDFDMQHKTIFELQKQNAKINIIIKRITSLHKAKKQHKPTAYQFSVVFIEDAEVADRQIQNGFIINRQILKAKHYTPHLYITQCYKCHHYVHRASNCKNKEKCRKCSKEHFTHKCITNTLKCINCGEDHKAWHIECSARNAEGR